MKRIVSIILTIVLMVMSTDYEVFALEKTVENETIESIQETEKDDNEDSEQTEQFLLTEENKTEDDEKNNDIAYDKFEIETELNEKDIILSEESTQEITLESTTEIENGNKTVDENEAEMSKTEICANSERDVTTESETEQLNEESVLDLKSSNELNEAVKNRILSFKSKYPENSIWGNEFNGWFQCCGFALKLGSEVFNGHWPRNLRGAANGSSSDGWTCYWVNASNCNSLVAEPGDIIDCPSGTSKSHTAMVLSVDNGKITCVQANYPSRDGVNNKVHWTECFNYNSNRSTLAKIYNVYGVTNAYIQNDGVNNTRKFRLWKPSDELKRNATGVEVAPHACDFNGAFTIATNNGNKVYDKTLKISGYATDYYGIYTVMISFFSGGYTNFVVVLDDVGSSFAYDYDMSHYGDYKIAVTVQCKNGVTHQIGEKTITYCNPDSISPTVSNVTISNTGSELYFNADATDNIGITEAWMVAKDDSGNEHRFEASVSENQISGTWSLGYFVGSKNITITVYAKDAAGNIGTNTIEKSVGGVTISPKELHMEVGGKTEINAEFDTLWFVKSAGFASEDNYNLLDVKTDGLKAQITALKPGFTSLDFSWNGEAGDKEIGNGITVNGGGSYAIETVCIYVIPNAPMISSVSEGDYDTIRFNAVDYAETYALYRRIEGYGSDYQYQLINVFEDDGTHFIRVKRPDYGTKYFYKMCAKSAAVKDLCQDGHPMYCPTSSFSNEVECSRQSNVFRVKSISNKSKGNVYMEVFPLDGASSYSIYKYKEGEDKKFLSNITKEEISENSGLIKYTDTGIKEIGNYYYEIYALDEANNLISILKTSCFVENVESVTDLDNTDGVLPEDIPADGIIPDGLWIAAIADAGYIGMAITPDAHVYDSNVRLHVGRDYTLSYKNNVNAGKSTITVTGKGNYSGKETAAFNILPADLSGDDFSMEAFYIKTGKKAQSPVPVIYYMGTKLKHKKDFTISYSNTSGVYATVGEYSATITGTGNYTGTREIKLTAVAKIAKTPSVSIAKASLAGFEKSFSYTGKAHKQECTLSVKTPEGEKTLTEGVDYTVRYTNNTKAGTAAVIYSGKNGYTGKLKKIYKITPYNIMYDAESKLNYENFFECAYAKGGSKPKPVITYDGRKLAEGADYTLSYKNNKAVYGKRMPSVIVNGKGNFKGKLELYFTINPQDLSKMTLVSCDKIYQKKAGIYRITPKLMDLDGKLLSAGKDFDKNSLTYIYETAVTLENGVTKQAGDTVEDSDIIPADTQIRVTFGSGTGGNYTGTFTGVYRIVKADMKSAKVTIPNQTYTGKEITLDKSKITVTLSGTRLKPEDYELIQYTDNVKKGKAAVTIKGTGNYGGTKTVKFTIGAKGFLWWKKKD